MLILAQFCNGPHVTRLPGQYVQSIFISKGYGYGGVDPKSENHIMNVSISIERGRSLLVNMKCLGPKTADLDTCTIV